MTSDFVATFLIITDREHLPAFSTISDTLASATRVSFASLPLETTGQSAGRQRIAASESPIPGLSANCRVTVWDYRRPVTSGLTDTALSLLSAGLTPDSTSLLREGDRAIEVRIAGEASGAAGALRWATDALDALARACAGIVMDPVTQRCIDEAALRTMRSGTLLSHVVVHDEPWETDTRWLHTHGLEKFGQVELEVVEVPVTLVEYGHALIVDVAATLVNGAELHAGGEIETDDMERLVVVAANSDPDHRARCGRVRLTDPSLPGELPAQGISRYLKHAALNDAAVSERGGKPAQALESIDHILAADPDDMDALAVKSRLLSRLGQASEALCIGELMQLWQPWDYRGYMSAGMALTELGRHREALMALDRAVQCDPEAIDALTVRSVIYERLGAAAEAEYDRARAKYLRA